MPTPHTHQSRQPSRVVGYISSGVSLGYAMAGLSISGMDLDGQRQLAGLDIYGRGFHKISNVQATARTPTSHSPSGAATSHQGQSIHPNNLAAANTTAARPAARSHFNDSPF